MRLFGLVSLGLVLACAAMAGGAIHTRRQARILLENLKRLDTNSDPSSSFNTFREKHRHQLANQECRDDFCQYEFVVKNWVLSTLRLAPPTELRARVTVFHRRLDAAGVDYTSAIFKENSPVVHVQEDFCADRTDIRCDHFALNPHGRKVGPYMEWHCRVRPIGDRWAKASGVGTKPRLPCLATRLYRHKPTHAQTLESYGSRDSK